MASSLCTYQTEHISTPPDVFVFPTAILTAKTESVCVAYASPLARGMDGKRPGGTAPALTGSLYRFATRTCAVHSPVWLTASLHCSFRAPGDSPTHLAGPLWGGTAALRLSSWKVEESASTGGCMLDGVHQSPTEESGSWGHVCLVPALASWAALLPRSREIMHPPCGMFSRCSSSDVLLPFCELLVMLRAP